MVPRNQDERYYMVPELEIRVHESWINLVRWCQEQMPFGDIKVRIVNGQPTELLEKIPRVRFDKQTTIPKESQHEDTKVLTNLIQYCIIIL